MEYIVYLTICTVNRKIYVGIHETEDSNVYDQYLGCGVYANKPSSYKKSKTPFQCAVNKYGPKNFRRITLRVYKTRKEASDMEAYIVDEEFIKRSDTYNIKLGGDNG